MNFMKLPTPKEIFDEIFPRMSEYQVFQYPYEAAAVTYNNLDESFINKYDYRDNITLKFECGRLEKLLSGMSGIKMDNKTVYKIMKRYSNDKLYVEFHDWTVRISSKITFREWWTSSKYYPIDQHIRFWETCGYTREEIINIIKNMRY